MSYTSKSISIPEPAPIETSHHNSRLIIHWREPEPYGALWVIRGLDPNGQFYGEVIASTLPGHDKETRKLSTGFSAQLTSAETDTVFQAARLIEGTELPAAGTGRLGLLAAGNYSQPGIVYEHYSENGHLEAAAHFLTIISVFRPHFHRYLQNLLKLARESGWPTGDQAL